MKVRIKSMESLKNTPTIRFGSGFLHDNGSYMNISSISPSMIRDVKVVHASGRWAYGLNNHEITHGVVEERIINENN